MMVWVGEQRRAGKNIFKWFLFEVFFEPFKKIFKISSKLDDLSNKNKSTKIAVFNYRLEKKILYLILTITLNFVKKLCFFWHSLFIKKL